MNPKEAQKLAHDIATDCAKMYGRPIDCENIGSLAYETAYKSLIQGSVSHLAASIAHSVVLYAIANESLPK